MYLSARMLENVVNVNSFDQVLQVRFSEGDSPNIYFSLIDLNQDLPQQGFSPSGRRYVPVANSSVSVVLDNIDDARKVTRSATQPYPTTDPSIWCVQLTPSDTVRGTVSMKLTLIEPSPLRTLHAYVPAAIQVNPGSALDSSVGWTGGTL
jgi:hypothetical protein